MDTSGGGSNQQPTDDQGSGVSSQPQPAQGRQDQPAVQPPPEPQAGKPAAAKEQEFVGQVDVSERVPIVEQREPRELPEEVEGWLERVERDDVAQPQPVVHQGKTVVSPAAPQDVKVTLPLTEDDVEQDLHRKVFESVRWLAEWCVRLVKKYHGKVAYKLKK